MRKDKQKRSSTSKIKDGVVDGDLEARWCGGPHRSSHHHLEVLHFEKVDYYHFINCYIYLDVHVSYLDSFCTDIEIQVVNIYFSFKCYEYKFGRLF
jgi:hypothetical protein